MFKALQFFNFGPSFIQWIKALYHKPEACIKNNGYFSEYFNIQRGVRQGCRVSSLIFILCVEVLAIKVRNSGSLRGFQFGYQKSVKLAQYADDGVLFLNNKLELGSALNILEKFGKLSGLKLNLGKCEGFWLGKDKALQSHSRCFGIKWPEQLRCLGIYLGYNNQLNDKKNFDDKVEEIERILSKWGKRDLSLFGRIQIIKTFAVSKIVLSASTQCVPDYIVKRLEGILFKFLWQSKDKVKRVRMIQNLESGGLNMINIKAFCHSLSANWIIRILEGNPDSSLRCWILKA